jgi:hypothetical protein
MKVRHAVLTVGEAADAELVELPSPAARKEMNTVMQVTVFNVKMMVQPPASDYELVSATAGELEQLQAAGFTLKRSV